MATFVVVDSTDSEGRVSRMRWRVTDAALPTGYQAYMSAVIAATFGTGKPSIGGVKRSYLEIDGSDSGIAPYGVVDVRNNWETRWQATLPSLMRLGIPNRDLSTGLVAAGSKNLADLSNAAWTAWVTAILGTSIQLEDARDGTIPTSIVRGLAGVHGRKRPREGGAR